MWRLCIGKRACIGTSGEEKTPKGGTNRYVLMAKSHIHGPPTFRADRDYFQLQRIDHNLLFPSWLVYKDSMAS